MLKYFRGYHRPTKINQHWIFTTWIISTWKFPDLRYLNEILIDTVTSHSDLGILFDDQLKFHDYTTQVTTKANRVLGLIKKWFEYLDSNMLTQLFSTLVRPILEYNNIIWGPHYIVDKRKVEKVQRRATRLFPHLHDKSYAERLTLLSLPSLQYRRLRGDLIFLYKVLIIILLQIFLIYTPTSQLLLLGGISSNCLRIIQGCYVGQIIFLAESLTIITVYQVIL